MCVNYKKKSICFSLLKENFANWEMLHFHSKDIFMLTFTNENCQNWPSEKSIKFILRIENPCTVPILIIESIFFGIKRGRVGKGNGWPAFVCLSTILKLVSYLSIVFCHAKNSSPFQRTKLKFTQNFYSAQ